MDASPHSGGGIAPEGAELGLFLRFLKYSATLIRDQWRTRREITAIQERRFRHIVRYAYDNVPFYRAAYRKANLTPDDIRVIADIGRLPFVTKDHLKTYPIEQRTSRRVDLKRCSIARTSGSTGEPLRVAVDDDASDFVRAYHLRRFLAVGFMPWYKLVVVGPTRRSIVTGPVVTTPAGAMFWGPMSRFLDHRTRFLPIDTGARQQASFYESFRPNAVLGPPSYFRALGRAVDGSQDWHPDKVLTWGEILDKNTREAVHRSLGSEVFDGYGCTEVAPVGGLAWECAEHSGMHVNADFLVLEVLKDGEAAAPGEVGEVVVTSLFRHAAPMIRYRLGDAAVLAGDPCPCGRGLPLLRELEGRIVDFLVMPSGRVISPYTISKMLELTQGISMYRVVQDASHHVSVKIEKGVGFSVSTGQEVMRTLDELFAGEVDLDYEFVERIEAERGRKFKAVARTAA